MRVKNAQALEALREKKAIDGTAWASLLRIIPSQKDGETLLQRGTKERFKHAKEQAAGNITLDSLALYGGTFQLVQVIVDQARWSSVLTDGAKLCNTSEMLRRHGAELVARPKIQVGTIHSAKGREADNVLLLTGMTRRPWESYMHGGAIADEERRVWYTGITRARQRLVLVREPQRNNMPI